VQLVGASIGTALLATLSVAAITASITAAATAGENPTSPAIQLQAQVDGYTTAFTWAAGLLLLGALVALLLVKAGKDDIPTDTDALVPAG
jgi:hypothetical protein